MILQMVAYGSVQAIKRARSWVQMVTFSSVQTNVARSM